MKYIELSTSKKARICRALGVSRVANEIALKYDSKNHVLQYCMASKIGRAHV